MKATIPAMWLCATLIFFAGCTRGEWSVTRELCGRVQILDKQASRFLTDTDLVLYKSNSENLACCSEAQKVAEIRIDSSGRFKSDRVDAGRYFLVVKDTPQIAFPEYLETSYDGEKCSLNTVYSFDRNTGKIERTATIVQLAK